MIALHENAPTVSIIVPVYNVEKYLERCLDSLLNQTAEVSYEIVCIDDCSSDGSSGILSSYNQRFPSLVKALKNSKNLGLGATRDRGVREASGDYLMFVDSDDYVRDDYLEHYLNAMQADPCDIVIGGYIDTDGMRETIHLLPHSQWTELCFSSACAKLYRKSFIQTNHLEFTDIRYAEDTLFNLFAFAKNPKCTVIDYAGYFYFANPSSITREKAYDKQLERTLSSLYRSFLRSAEYAGLPQEKREMVEYSYVADMLSTILLFARGCGKDVMSDKHRFFKEDLMDIFPAYRENPHLSLIGPKGQRAKIRIGVSLFVLFDRIHMDKGLFSLFA